MILLYHIIPQPPQYDAGTTSSLSDRLARTPPVGRLETKQKVQTANQLGHTYGGLWTIRFSPQDQEPRALVHDPTR
jgi:hypothetical protein